ncbi:uncharacterized protein LOC143876799 isoform X2 [Tasmannia lanceolata]|uniref:uncharacterized protein LOC143876799 isoform X2 n=1 Tax=Tasmannia lanceolata TaxID=3420 RepID=UPI00406296B9
MRIRKRSLLPFILPNRSEKDPLSTQNPSQIDKKGTEEQHREESDEKVEEEAKETEGGFHLKIDRKGKRWCMFPIQIPKQVEVLKEEEEERWSAKDKGSPRNGKTNPLGAETARIPFSSQATRWHEGETAFPLKKRKGSYDWEREETMIEKEKKRMKKTKKKHIDNEEAEEEMDGGVKKRRKRSALMEGSRCSRVNGRGWRCCQQTLVGYSLCEHHLGKGRLKSMSSTYTITKPNNDGEENFGLLSSSVQKPPEKDMSPEKERDEHSPVRKKRKKIGIVKARSIRSLLGQTQALLPTTIISTTIDNTLI